MGGRGLTKTRSGRGCRGRFFSRTTKGETMAGTKNDEARMLIDQFGRMALIDAAHGELRDDIPNAMRARCAAAGEYLNRIAADQRAFEKWLDCDR
jgi:hypothetical protein